MSGVLQGLLFEKHPYSPGGYRILHTELDIVHYTVCETASVLPMSITKYFPHSCVKMVLQRSHWPHWTIFSLRM